MPFKSDKQKKYFFAKLNSLPKGSPEYNKWKKVVDKFVAHSVDESYELDEARSNPEVNVDQPVAKQIEQFVDKYKGQEQLIFISFRDDVYVTFINPRNVFNTPTGIYTYPWENFYDNKFEKYVKDYLVPNVGKNIPYAGDRKYMFLYKLKSNKGILTNQTTYNDTFPYANKLLNLVKNNKKAFEIVNAYVNDYERYITDYYNKSYYARTSFGDVHKFWILLYLVGDYITKGKTQDTIGNLCRAIGVNGFVDFDGKGYIHTNEPHQAVFFRGRELFDDIKIINTLQSGNKLYNRNLLDYINNKEYIENLNADRVESLLSNAPNNEFLNLIIDKLLSNKIFVSYMDELIFKKIMYYANPDKIDSIINIVLSNENFLDKDINEKIFDLLKYSKIEKRISIINTLLKNQNYLDKINTNGLKYIIEYSPIESNYSKDKIIKYVVNNNETASKIYGNTIEYLLVNSSKEYKNELIDTLLKRDNIVNNYGSVYFLMSSSFERRDEIVDELLQNKSFLSFIKLELNDSSPRVIDFLHVDWPESGEKLLSEISKQKMANKMIEIRPDIVEKLFTDNQISKVILILKYGKFNLDSIINNLNPNYINTNHSLYAVLINLSHPKTFVEERISVERMKVFFQNYNYTYMVDVAKNKKEMAELIVEYTGEYNFYHRIEKPMNEIFKSLTSLQEELNEQNKETVKEKNRKKVKDFLLQKKELLDEDISSGSVTVYHRTGRKGSPIEGIAADGYIVGKGATYGVGVYTTYDLESQLKPNMIMAYGNIIIESKVLSMDKFLIFDYDIAKKIYGNVNYTLDNQLRLILGKDWNKFKDNDILKKLIEQLTVVEYTSNVAIDFYQNFKDTIVRNLRGIVFTGQQDGKVLISYDRKNVEPLRYTTDEAQTWTNIINKNIYQRLKEYKPEESDINFQHILNKLDTTSNINDNEVNFIINNIDKFIKILDLKKIIFLIRKSSEPDKFINALFNSSNKDFIINQELDYHDIWALLKVSSEPDKIINLLGEKGKNFIINLESYNISHLIYESRNPDKIIDILFNIGGKEFIMNLDYYSIKNLIQNSSSKNKIIDTLLDVGGKEFIMNLNLNDIIYDLLRFSSDRDKTIDILFNIGGKDFVMNLDSVSISNLLNFSSEVDKVINLLGGKDFAMKLDSKDIANFKNIRLKNYDKIIDTLLDVGGKDFVMKNSTIELLNKFMSENNTIFNKLFNKFFNKIINIGGKNYIKNLMENNFITLVSNSKQSDIILNTLLNIGGKEFKTYLNGDNIFFLLIYSSKPETIFNLLPENKRKLFKEFIIKIESRVLNGVLRFSKNSEELKKILEKYVNLSQDNITSPMNEIFKSLTSLQKELNEQNNVNMKQKNLEKVKQFLLEKRKPLLEDEFYFNSLPNDKKESIYNLFKQSYEGSVGTSWSKDKFYSRAYDWLFFGDENGFVAVRTQKSGLYKLVGVAGSLKSILNGFNELQSKNVPIWGMVSKDIQQMAHKKGFITPPPFLLKILYKLIPNSVFGNTEFDVNSDGSLTLKYSDVGDAVKYFIGNDEYFKSLKSNILPSMKDEFSKLPSLTKMMINKFLPESVNTLNEELLDEDISSGSVTVYHRTGKYGNDSALKGIAADGYRVGGGAMYGVGVYTTYDLESQLQDYLRNTYGNIIIESKVLSMDKFLIFDYDIAKKIYGNVNYTLDNQLRLILGNNWRYFKDNSILKNIIEQVAIVKYTADVADTFYKNFTDTIVRNLRGIVFTGRNDGKVLVSYDRKNVEPLRYTTDEAQNWTNIINKNIYQRLKGYKSEEKETHVEHILNKLDVKPKELTDGEINYIIKNIPLFLKRGLTLSKMIKFIIEISNDNSKKIIEYIKNIFEKDGQFLSSYVTKEDAKYIGREYNIPKIYSKIIFKLLIKYGGIEFINKLIGDEGIRGLYWFGENSFYRTIIDTMLKYNGKEFLVKNFSEIDTIIYEYFNLYSKDNTENDTTDKFINKMIKIGGKELLYKLATNIKSIGNSNIPLIQTLLFKITDKNYPVIIDNMLKIGGKEFVNALDKDTLRYMYTKYQNSESLTQKLLKISGKEFADKYKDMIFYLVPNYKDYEKIRDMFSMYDTDQTPMNEIFKSLTSLQEELTEQRKVTIKESNLMKVQNFIKKRKSNQ